MRWRDKRIERLWRALEHRFPGATLATKAIVDKGVYDECIIKVLNAPGSPPTRVDDFANPLICEIWGDEPVPVLIDAIGREQTAVHYADLLDLPRAARQSLHLPPLPRPKRRRRARAAASSAR